VNPFVDECRREWKRLGLADPVANEMAADLEADIAEAEAEGGSAEDVLGVEVFDAPAFARSWAEARGVIPPSPAPAAPPSTFRRWYPVAGIAACLLVAFFGVLLLVAKPDRHVTMAIQAGFVIPSRIQKLGPGVPPRFRLLKPQFRKEFLPGRGVFVPPGNPGPNLDLAGALFLLAGLGGAAGFGFVLFRRSRGAPATA
jgi:hypothetical protein